MTIGNDDFEYKKQSFKKALKCLKIAAEEILIPKMIPELEVLCPKDCIHLKKIDGEYYCVWKLSKNKGYPMRHELCTVKDIKIDESKIIRLKGEGNSK